MKCRCGHRAGYEACVVQAESRRLAWSRKRFELYGCITKCTNSQIGSKGWVWCEELFPFQSY